MTQGWRRQHERPGDDHIHITMVTIDMWKTWLPGTVHTQRHTSASHVSGKCSGVQQFNTKMSWHISPLHLKSDLIQLDGWPAGHLVRRVPTSWRSHKWSISVLRSRCWVLTYHKQIETSTPWQTWYHYHVWSKDQCQLSNYHILQHREIYLLQY